ncbi:MAG: serine/threonine-protein kinase [Candidatus Eremiobacterota bacterium]
MDTQPLSMDKVVRGRYKITNIVGQGGQCFVYEAEDIEEKKRLILKELRTDPDEPSIHAENIVLFKKEYEILRRLEHPGLPKGYDYFEEEGNHFLLVQDMGGKNLERLLREQNTPFEESVVLGWAIQLADILVYLYNIKPYPVVVRDIKPSDIVVSEDNHISLIDFTVAKEFKGLNNVDTVRIGSRGYAPPEQYEGHTEPRSDIYSLGISLHRLLTGEDPSSIDFHLKPLRKYNQDFSKEFEYVLFKATGRSLDKRYSRPEELLRDLKYVKDEFDGIPHPEFVIPSDIYPSEKSTREDATRVKSFAIKTGICLILISLILIICFYENLIVNYMLLKAGKLYDEKDINGTITACEHVLRHDPDNLQANYYIGVIYFYSDKRLKGEEYLNKLNKDLNFCRDKCSYHYKRYQNLKDKTEGAKELEIATFLSDMVKKSVEIPDN